MTTNERNQKMIWITTADCRPDKGLEVLWVWDNVNIGRQVVIGYIDPSAKSVWIGGPGFEQARLEPLADFPWWQPKPEAPARFPDHQTPVVVCGNIGAGTCELTKGHDGPHSAISEGIRVQWVNHRGGPPAPSGVYAEGQEVEIKRPIDTTWNGAKILVAHGDDTYVVEYYSQYVAHNVRAEYLRAATK